MKDALKDAISQRRGKGITISILVGEPKDEEGKTDLAPSGVAKEAPAHEDEAQDKSLFSQMMAEQEAKESEPSEINPEEDQKKTYDSMMSGMNEHDMGQMEDHKPRSLGERARQFAMSKMKKK